VTEQSDSHLLRAYAERRLEAAFSELVGRHVDFVYSAAIRMVRDSHLAEDVTQGVFIALAKQASSLTERATLTGWLHRTAQNIAAQTVRTTERRRTREQEAVAMNELISASPEASWEQIAPHLDAALGELTETDRDAVLLRYFDNRSATEMAGLLGISDAAAQKRVSRAVERLREVFARRGVTVGVGGLVVAISAHAVQAAPAGLAVTVSAAALAGAATTTSILVAATTKTIAMTMLQKAIVATTVTVLAGVGLYEARLAVQLHDQIQSLHQERASSDEQTRQLQRERDDARNDLAGLRDELATANSNRLELLKLRGEVGRLKKNANSEVFQSAEFAVRNANLLKEYFRQNPSAQTPELQFLASNDWLTKAFNSRLGVVGMDQSKAYRLSASELRSEADRIAGWIFMRAAEAYAAKNNGQFPTDIYQLKPYMKRSEYRSDSTLPIEDLDAMLNRWEIVPAKQIKSMIAGGNWAITQKAAVDDLLDERIVVGQGIVNRPFVLADTFAVLQPVRAVYKAALGWDYVHATDLQPYATTPEQMTAVKKLIEYETWNNY